MRGHEGGGDSSKKRLQIGKVGGGVGGAGDHGEVCMSLKLQQ